MGTFCMAVYYPVDPMLLTLRNPFESHEKVVVLAANVPNCFPPVDALNGLHLFRLFFINEKRHLTCDKGLHEN